MHYIYLVKNIDPHHLIFCCFNDILLLPKSSYCQQALHVFSNHFPGCILFALDPCCPSFTKTKCATSTAYNLKHSLQSPKLGFSDVVWKYFSVGDMSVKFFCLKLFSVLPRAKQWWPSYNNHTTQCYKQWSGATLQPAFSVYVLFLFALFFVSNRI